MNNDNQKIVKLKCKNKEKIRKVKQKYESKLDRERSKCNSRRKANRSLNRMFAITAILLSIISSLIDYYKIKKKI